MPKISLIPSDASPTIAYRVVGVNAAGSPTTVDLTLATLITLFWTLANVPSGGTSPITRDNESQSAFVASGMVWSGDAYASTRNASMTTGVVYINGRRISISAVVARTFTASKDTYIDILDNGDGTGTLVYTEVANNAASPALAANSIRIGIIVTGVSAIAAAGSVNQGSPSAVLPIASSIAYSVADSLGNLICNRDPQSKLLCWRQISTQPASTSATSAQITGLSCPVNNLPSNRKVKIKIYTNVQNTANTDTNNIDIYDGTVPSGTLLNTSQTQVAIANAQLLQITEVVVLPTASSKTFNAGFRTSAGTITLNNVGSEIAFMKAELY